MWARGLGSKSKQRTLPSVAFQLEVVISLRGNPTAEKTVTKAGRITFEDPIHSVGPRILSRAGKRSSLKPLVE